MAELRMSAGEITVTATYKESTVQISVDLNALIACKPSGSVPVVLIACKPSVPIPAAFNKKDFALVAKSELSNFQFSFRFQ